MTLKIIPLFDRVIVERDIAEQTADGVMLPSEGYQNHDQIGMEFNTATILSVGDGVEDTERLKPGARIVVGKYAFESGAGGAMGTVGARLCINMAEVVKTGAKPQYHWVLMEKDIIGLIEEEPNA